jgi:membrane associated rhomboid family serine protease
MFTLWMFAPVVMGQLGNFHFINLFRTLFWEFAYYGFHNNDYGYRALGASGAVTGNLYSIILCNPI